MSAELAMFGINAVMGLAGGVTARANIYAQNRIDEANTYAKNLVRGANNELAAKRGSLARFTQSVNNNRALENTGAAAEAATVNYRRARDSRIKDDFETQIKFAEQAGAQAAAAGASGLIGGVADIVAGTTALRKARLEQRTAEATKQGDYDAAKRNRMIHQAGWDSLDHSEIADTLDYGKDVAVTRVHGGSFWSEVLGAQSKNTLSAAWEAGSKLFI